MSFPVCFSHCCWRESCKSVLRRKRWKILVAILNFCLRIEGNDFDFDEIRIEVAAFFGDLISSNANEIVRYSEIVNEIIGILEKEKEIKDLFEAMEIKKLQ